jgi:L-cystine transport system permease protein
MGAYFSLDRFKDAFSPVMSGMNTTLIIVGWSFLIAFLLGIVFAIVKIKKLQIARQIVSAFISFMRGTPMIVQLYLVYYGLPFLVSALFRVDINRWDKIIFVIIAIGINNASFFAEIFRSSIESVSIDQTEAGLSVGLTWMQTFCRVVLPQAMSVALPSLIVQFISLLQSTALAYLFGVEDIMTEARKVGTKTGHSLEAYLVVTVVYVVICVLLELLSRALQKRMNRGRRAA